MATAKRIKFIITKWTSFESQLANLENIVSDGEYEITSLKLRMTRMNEVYRNFEEYKDELSMLEPNHPLLNEFIGIQNRYFAIAGNVENISTAMSETRSVASSENGHSATVGNSQELDVSKRRIKLPTAALPTFDGKYEDWLSFKNAFTAMIHSQSYLSDIEKFQYLKSSLTKEAANKIKIFSMTGENYMKAWDILERSYEVKRILINQHLAMLTNLPAQREETTQGLDKLADDVQQHSQTLNSLGVSVPSEMLVHLVESKLHRKTAEKWEESLEREEIPTIEKMCDFLYKTAVCVSKRNKRGESTQEHSTKGQPPTKKKKRFENSKQHAFVINTSNNCALCKDVQHPLYRCEKFRALAVPKRIEVIKKAKLCINCMKYHKDRQCVYGTCTVCSKKHNSMLHLNSPSTVKSSRITRNKTSENDKTSEKED